MRWRRRPRWRRGIRASSAWSSARPTRISRSACAARASCSWIAGRESTRDEAGVDREVRRAAGVDSRLPGARRRRGRRLSGPAGLGREVGGGRARQVRPPRGDSRRLADVAASTPPTPAALARTLARDREQALLFRDLATLRTDIRCSSRSTSSSGAGRRRRSRRSRRGSTRPRPDAIGSWWLSILATLMKDHVGHGPAVVLHERQLRVDDFQKEFRLRLGKDLDLRLSRQLRHQAIAFPRDGEGDTPASAGIGQRSHRRSSDPPWRPCARPRPDKARRGGSQEDLERCAPLTPAGRSTARSM